MNKQRSSAFWRRWFSVSPWAFLLIAIASAVICVFALRANNQHMIELRAAVYKADEQNGDVQAALKNLQAYVTSHMNTNLSAGPNAVYPPIQLKYTYERLQQAQNQNVAGNQAYTEAQAYCEQQNPTDFSGRNRIPCIQQYVQSHTSQPVPSIPDALYKFSFVSPKWSPDLAGWSLAAAILSGLLFVVSLIGHWWLKRTAKVSR